MGRIINRRSHAPARSSAPHSQPNRTAQASQARQATTGKPATQPQAARPAATQPAAATAKPAAAAAKPSASPASEAAKPATKDQATVSKPDAKGSDAKTEASAKSVLSGIGKWANDLVPAGVKDVAQKLTQDKNVKLTDAERKQVQQAAGVLDRLAGADKLWNHGDLGNNVKQLEKSGDLGRAVNSEIGNRVAQEKSSRGLIGRKLVDMHMNRNYGKYFGQGMQQARGMAHDQLQSGLDTGGVKRTAGHDAARAEKAGPEAAANAGKPISRAEMEQFQKTMDMLKARSKAQGLPEVNFPKGIPAGFLHNVGDGQSPLQTILEAGGGINFK